MNKYLTTKLAEEGSEVAQAACKVLLHGPACRQRLIAEMADMQAMLNMAQLRMDDKDLQRFQKLVAKRMNREHSKGRA